MHSPVIVRPVEPNLNTPLPLAFRSKLMNPAILVLAAGMYTHAERDGYVRKVELILDEVGTGFCRQFDETPFSPESDDPQFVQKNNLLAAISEVADRFAVSDPGSPIKSLIPVQVFEAYAYNACSGAHTMVNPTDSNWWVRPAALHAAMVVSEFALLMHAATCKHTGQTIHHVSCCGCSIEPATVVYDIQSHKLPEVATSVTEWFLKMCSLEVVHSHREFGPTLEFPLLRAA